MHLLIVTSHNPLADISQLIVNCNLQKDTL